MGVWVLILGLGLGLPQELLVCSIHVVAVPIDCAIRGRKLVCDCSGATAAGWAGARDLLDFEPFVNAVQLTAAEFALEVSEQAHKVIDALLGGEAVHSS